MTIRPSIRWLLLVALASLWSMLFGLGNTAEGSPKCKPRVGVYVGGPLKGQPAKPPFDPIPAPPEKPTPELRLPGPADDDCHCKCSPCHCQEELVEKLAREHCAVQIAWQQRDEAVKAALEQMRRDEANWKKDLDCILHERNQARLGAGVFAVGFAVAVLVYLFGGPRKPRLDSWCVALVLALGATAEGAVPPEAHQAIARIYNASGHCAGSGTLIGKDERSGLIVTCYHLFNDGRTGIIAIFPDAEQFAARVVATDQRNDLAALVIAPPKVEPVVLANYVPQRGEVLFSAGFGSTKINSLSINAGTLVAYTDHGDGSWQGLKLTGAARNGDSGGPIFNDNGELAGVLHGTGDAVYGTGCKQINVMLAQCPDGVCPPRRRIFLRPRPPAPPIVPAGPQLPPQLPGPAPYGPDQPPAQQPPPIAQPPEVPQSVIDRIRADAEASLQPRIQAAIKAERDRIGQQIGVPQPLQDILDAKAAALEQAIADKAKASQLGQDLQAKVGGLNQTIAEKVASITELNGNLANKDGLLKEHAPLLDKLKTLQQQIADGSLPELTGLQGKLEAQAPLLAKLRADLASNGGALADAEAKLAAVAPELAGLKAGLLPALPWVAQGLIAVTGFVPGVGVPIATALTVLMGLAGGFGLAKTKLLGGKTLAGAIVAASPINAQTAPPAAPQATQQATAAPSSTGSDLWSAVKKATAEVLAASPPTAAPAPAPPKAPDTYAPQYALDPRAFDELAVKRQATQGMSMGQQGLLAQIQQEATAKMKAGHFAQYTDDATKALAMEHWIMGRLMSAHGVRTTLDPGQTVLPGQANF